MERRTIPELVTLYELEPSVRDIYVEGPTDRAFVMAVLRRVGRYDIQVKEVDVVDVPSTELTKLGLTIGSRQRVIAVALLLERASTTDLITQVACIADADAEAGSPPAINGRLLLYTDVACMTVYAFHVPYVQWYLDIEVLDFHGPGNKWSVRYSSRFAGVHRLDARLRT